MDKTEQDKLNKNLILACKKGDLELVTSLVEDGANIHYDEGIALIEASHYNHLHIVKYLIDEEKNVNEKEIKANKVLMYALMHGHISFVKYFVDEKNYDPNIILIKAAAYGHLHIVKHLILDKKCDPEMARKEAMIYDKHTTVDWCNSYINSRDLKNKFYDELVNNNLSSQKRKI